MASMSFYELINILKWWGKSFFCGGKIFKMYCWWGKDGKVPENVTVYGFPSEPEQQGRWVKSLPNKLTYKVSKYIRICAKHWPTDCHKVKLLGGSFIYLHLYSTLINHTFLKQSFQNLRHSESWCKFRNEESFS